jgi:hypothetical protein
MKHLLVGGWFKVLNARSCTRLANRSRAPGLDQLLTVHEIPWDQRSDDARSKCEKPRVIRFDFTDAQTDPGVSHGSDDL